MIVHVARRGHSFKGAGLYYLHDKQADTSERVAWTHTHNLPTDDPEKGLRWMAYTSKNAERLKEEAGVARTGRKATAGCVYAFALSWHPEQKPEKEHMMMAAFDTLERLGLKEHEAVMVAHQDTDHPHVHVICNLVNTQNGRTAVPSYDRLTLSTWAQGYEEKDGKIYCEERVKNNEKRREQALDGRELALVKHREQKLETAQKIQELYNQSDNGKAFDAALKEAGLTLAQGDRRGFVIVDEYGKIHSLSRQLEGQRARDISARLSDLDQKALPQAKTVAEERMYFDRDRYEADWQKHIVDGAIEEDERKQQGDGKKQNPDRAGEPEGKPFEAARGLEQPSSFQETAKQAQTETDPPKQDDFLKDLDRLRAWEQAQDRKRFQLESELNSFYRRDEHSKKIVELQAQIAKSDNSWGKISGKLQKLQDELEAHERSLANIDQRIAEQVGKLENEIAKTKPLETEKPASKDLSSATPTQMLDERLLKIKKFKERVRQRDRTEKEREQGFDRDI